MKEEQKWTKEPWRLETIHSAQFITDGKRPIAKVLYYHENNAQRIIACINACAGVDNLPKGIVSKIVEALKEFTKDDAGRTSDEDGEWCIYCQQSIGWTEPDRNNISRHKADCPIAKARAILAELEPKG